MVTVVLETRLTRQIARRGQPLSGAEATFQNRCQEEMVDLILAIGAINIWNRIGVTTHL